MIAGIILSTTDISTPDLMEHRLRASAQRILQMDFYEKALFVKPTWRPLYVV